MEEITENTLTTLKISLETLSDIFQRANFLLVVFQRSRAEMEVAERKIYEPLLRVEKIKYSQYYGRVSIYAKNEKGKIVKEWCPNDLKFEEHSNFLLNNYNYVNNSNFHFCFTKY